MRIDTSITSSGMFDTTSLATIEDYNDDVPSGLFRPEVLAKFASELKDVDGHVEVSIQNLEYADESSSEKALVGRVDGTQVACVACPVVPNDSEARGPSLLELGGDV